MKINKEMSNRFGEIRQKEGITQAEFAKKLKIGRSTVTNLENGVASFTSRNIEMLCLVFNVNENWFRTGVGEMFNPSQEEPISEKEKMLLTVFRKLIPEMQDFVLEKTREALRASEELWIPEDYSKEKREKMNA